MDQKLVRADRDQPSETRGRDWDRHRDRVFRDTSGVYGDHRDSWLIGIADPNGLAIICDRDRLRKSEFPGPAPGSSKGALNNPLIAIDYEDVGGIVGIKNEQMALGDYKSTRARSLFASQYRFVKQGWREPI